MSNSKNMKVTRSPAYAIDKDNKYAKFSIEIDNIEYSTTIPTEGFNSEARLVAALTKKMSKSLKDSFNNRSNVGLTAANISEIDSMVGNPEKIRPDQMLQRRGLPDSPMLSFPATGEDTLSSRNPDLTKPDEPTQKIMKKGIPRNHMPFPEVGPSYRRVLLDGTGEHALGEPVPDFVPIPGTLTIPNRNHPGGRNNTAIIFGRDFTPQRALKFSKDITNSNVVSRFADHQGAGAIDIVVGRMAPFPLDKIGAEPIKVFQSFNTSNPPELKSVRLNGGMHPGHVMDAARIYISQMTLIDKNFNITERIYTGQEPSNAVVPTSGIMLKADKVRLHSRHDIKIVTGGPHEKVNSQGNNIGTSAGIHLISENGQDRNAKQLPQHPMVLGNNLVECLSMILKLVEQLNRRLDTFVKTQTDFNTAIGFGFDMLPVPNAISIRDPGTTWQTILTTLGSVNNRFDGLYVDINNFQRITKYLTDGSRKYINSKHNTVN